MGPNISGGEIPRVVLKAYIIAFINIVLLIHQCFESN